MNNQQGYISQNIQRLREKNEAIQKELSNPKNINKSQSGNNSINNQIPIFKSTQAMSLNQNISSTQPKDKQQCKPSTEVLEEFRALIQKTSQLTSKGLNIPFSGINNQQEMQKNQVLNPMESDDSLEIDDDFNVSNSDSENEFNTLANEINTHQSQSLSIHPQQSELEKVKMTNQILTRSNIDLRNSNKILDLELSSYQANPLYSKASIAGSQYDDNLSQFILNVKSSLVQSIKSNIQLQETIAAILTENEKQTNDNLAFHQGYSKMRKDIEFTNRKNAEIQIANEDNATTLSCLEEDNQKLKEQLIAIQNEYEELKNEEENMLLINESNQKRKMDNDDLVFQLKMTIENLLKGYSDSSHRKENSEKEIEDSSRSINDCIYTIQEINDEINRKEAENEKIENEIEKKKKVLDEKDNLANEINSGFDEKKEEVDSAIKENEKLKGIAKEKENLIKIMKEKIAMITHDIQKNIHENDDSDINEKILIAKKENEQKDNEIEEMTAKYQKIVEQKDDIIKSLAVISN